MFGNTIAYPSPFNTNENIELMTVPELAEYLGIGRNRAYDLLRSGVIKRFRIGSTWKVCKEAVDQYIKKNSGLA